MALHDRLKEERNRLLLSQEDFAEKAGVSRNTQVRYETGKTMPSSTYLETVRTMGVDVDYVLFGVPDGEVVCTYLELRGDERKVISLEDCRRHASDISLGGIRWGRCCRTCQKNPIMHRVIHKAPTEIDGALLASIIEGVETALDKAGKRATATKKAQAAVTLYRASKASGQLDAEMVEQIALLAAE